MASSSLVPHDDPTLLFVNAGMNQFKDTFLGLESRDYQRATTVQKCVRAGGKHNDLENVGVTARHHTFFEMLGNFSFGDYFKKEAIDFAWEFLVDELGLDPERLEVTIFEGDDDVERDAEAHELWGKYFPDEKIRELGKKDNFWSMGDTGPVRPVLRGPLSSKETISHATSPSVSGSRVSATAGSRSGISCSCSSTATKRASSLRLPAPSVDTGMGLERIAAVVQGVRSNYDTDLFTSLLDTIGKRTNKTYGGSDSDDDVSLRVIADHLRASTFLISDGVMPANDGRGYVLRKIMRRGMRHGKKLGVDEPFLYELTEAVIDEMQEAYPDLLLGRELVHRVVLSEEERFRSTLATGIAALEDLSSRVRTSRSPKCFPARTRSSSTTRSGCRSICSKTSRASPGVSVDSDGFDREMEAPAPKGAGVLDEQRRRSRPKHLRRASWPVREPLRRLHEHEGRRPRARSDERRRRGTPSSRRATTAKCFST